MRYNKLVIVDSHLVNFFGVWRVFGEQKTKRDGEDVVLGDGGHALPILKDKCFIKTY